MICLIVLMAGVALYGAQTAKTLRVKRPVPAHVQLRDLPVNLKMDLVEIRGMLSKAVAPGGTGAFERRYTALQKIPDKANAVARRAARAMKKLPQMVKAVAAEAQATRNDPFAKKPAKSAAMKRLKTMEGLEERSKKSLAAIRDDALSLHGLGIEKLKTMVQGRDQRGPQ